MRREKQSSTCGMERKERGEIRRKWKGDKMNERDMKAEGQNGKKRGGE
jgi:hypothetical protein